MVKTFANIWLNVLQPRLEVPGSVSSTQTIKDLSVDFVLDDLSILANFQKFLPAKPSDQSDPFASAPPALPTLLGRHRPFKTGVLHVLGDCITRLLVVVSADRPLVGDLQVGSFVYQPLEDRFDLTGPDFAGRVLGGVHTNAHKLQKDVKCVVVVLERLCEEIRIFSTCTFVDSVLEMHRQMGEDERGLRDECETNVRVFHGLQREVRGFERTVRRRVFKELEEATTAQSKRLKDADEYATTEVEYLTKWEDARREQNLMKLRNEERGYEATIGYFLERRAAEGVVNDNVQKYLSEATDDYYKEIDQLMVTYDKDLETKDNEILQKRILLERVRDKKNALEKLYETRANEMEQWLEYKRIKKEKLDRELLENHAATAIQAWWRGVMVRKKLGRYRRKKKGKKGDKKSKKGRKNKK